MSDTDTTVLLAGSQRLCSGLEEAGHAVVAFRGEASSVRSELPARVNPPRLALLDLSDASDSGPESSATIGEADALFEALRRRWPLLDVLVVAPGASAESVRRWIRSGARDVFLDEAPSVLLSSIEEIFEAQRVLPMVEDLSKRRVRTSRFEGMLSRSHALWDVFETCARVAPTDANVLICGETGTGKELLARALHRRSKRRGRFRAINCSSLPEHLIESELFGHEKGAFTGATRAKAGLFRSAEAGTIFLDEIGDMSASAQQSLLRVLQDRTIRPVGGSVEIPIDVRVVAATHVQLEESVSEGHFREDLFYRLDVIRLQIPPLRERPEDIVYLFGHFLKSHSKHYGVEPPRFGDDLLDELTRYTWPGNVRELENFSERVVLRRKRTIEAPDFASLVRPVENGASSPTDVHSASASGNVIAQESMRSTPTAKNAPQPLRGLDETLQPIIEESERNYLVALLRETNGRMQVAAGIAGVSRRTLQRKLAMHGIDKADYRST